MSESQNEVEVKQPAPAAQVEGPTTAQRIAAVEEATNQAEKAAPIPMVAVEARKAGERAMQDLTSGKSVAEVAGNVTQTARAEDAKVTALTEK